MGKLMLTVFAASLLGLLNADLASAKEEKLALDKVPARVMQAAKKRFPNAKLHGAEKEVEDGKSIFELSLTEKAGQKVDLSLDEDGTILEIERQLKESDLPKPVRQVLKDKYAGGKLKIVEEVILIKEGKEALDCYEIKIAQGVKVTELKIAADGKIKQEEAEDADDAGENDE